MKPRAGSARPGDHRTGQVFQDTGVDASTQTMEPFSAGPGTHRSRPSITDSDSDTDTDTDSDADTDPDTPFRPSFQPQYEPLAELWGQPSRIAGIAFQAASSSSRHRLPAGIAFQPTRQAKPISRRLHHLVRQSFARYSYPPWSQWVSTGAPHGSTPIVAALTPYLPAANLRRCSYLCLYIMAAIQISKDHYSHVHFRAGVSDQ